VIGRLLWVGLGRVKVVGMASLPHYCPVLCTILSQQTLLVYTKVFVYSTGVVAIDESFDWIAREQDRRLAG
jgi:hypothetical protein